MTGARLALQQRVFAAYRKPFFEMLGGASPAGFHLFAGDARPSEHIPQADGLAHGSFTHGHNQHIGSGRFYFLRQPGLLPWLKEVKPQVLVVEANARYLSTPQAVHWMHARGGKVIGWGLGSPELYGLGSNWMKSQRGKLYDGLDAIITYSQQGAQEYHAAGFKSEMIFVAPNAATARPDHPAPERPTEFKGGRPKVLFVGRLQERKRVDLLIRACRQLTATRQPELWVVGDGPELDSLRQTAARFYPSTQFFGALFGEALESKFRQADLFVLPGTGGLALQQAMSFGLPVLAAEGDGTQNDLIRPGNGWLLKPGDENDLVEKLFQALSDLPALREKGRHSFAIVRDEINLERMVETFAQAIAYVRPTKS